MSPQSSPATLHIVRVEQDIINDTGLYEVAYSQERMSEPQPRIRQFLGEQPLMEFLERDLQTQGADARRIVDEVRGGKHVHLPVTWTEQDVHRFGLGALHKVA
jgi:hypothetical protein